MRKSYTGFLIKSSGFLLCFLWMVTFLSSKLSCTVVNRLVSVRLVLPVYSKDVALLLSLIMQEDTTVWNLVVNK